MSHYGESDTDRSARQRHVRRKLMTAFAIFALVQTFVAFLVTRRSKAATHRRERERAPEYPARQFDEVVDEASPDSVHLYMRGRELMDAIVEAIDGAQQYVYIETFIWIDDTTGQRLRDALTAAVERGVRCNVIYDWVLSSRSLETGFFHPDVRVFAFRPIRGRDAIRPSNVLRDHRKIVVIDSEIGFIGGYNFGNEYVAWRDTHARLVGPSVHELENAFTDFWNQHRPILMDPLPSAEQRSWEATSIIHRNDPSLAIFPIRGMYLEAIDRAKERVWITNAYFVPDRAFRTALEAAARRGVDVRVMLPARSNHPLTDALAHGIFDDLLAAGVRIFLYRDYMVHAKTATIDGLWATIGTANLDRWSMLGNFEINVEIRNDAVAAHMETMFEFDLEHAFEIRLDAWRRRPAHMRLAERTLRSLAPLM